MTDFNGGAVVRPGILSHPARRGNLEAHRGRLQPLALLLFSGPGGR